MIFKQLAYFKSFELCYSTDVRYLSCSKSLKSPFIQYYHFRTSKNGVLQKILPQHQICNAFMRKSKLKILIFLTWASHVECFQRHRSNIHIDLDLKARHSEQNPHLHEPANTACHENDETQERLNLSRKRHCVI